MRRDRQYDQEDEQARPCHEFLLLRTATSQVCVADNHNAIFILRNLLFMCDERSAGGLRVDLKKFSVSYQSKFTGSTPLSIVFQKTKNAKCNRCTMLDLLYFNSSCLAHWARLPNHHPGVIPTAEFRNTMAPCAPHLQNIDASGTLQSSAGAM